MASLIPVEICFLFWLVLFLNCICCFFSCSFYNLGQLIESAQMENRHRLIMEKTLMTTVVRMISALKGKSEQWGREVHMP